MILTLILYISFITITLLSFLTIESFAQWTIPSLDSVNSQKKINFSTYEKNDSNFKIDYPSNWILLENSSSNIEFHPPTTSQSEGSGVVVKMNAIPLPSNLITMQSI